MIPIFMLILLFVFYQHATKDRNLPKLEVTDKDLAIRGNIISKDGYRIANSHKLYKATIDTRNLDPNKKDLFSRILFRKAALSPVRLVRTIVFPESFPLKV